MDNVFSWIYFPATANSPIKVKSPQADYFTLSDIEKILTPREIGNKKQIELMKVLDFIKQAKQEGINYPEEFYID